MPGKLTCKPLPDVVDKSHTRLRPHRPELGPGNTAEPFFNGLQVPPPALFAAGAGPKVVGFERVPSGGMDAVSDITDRHFRLRPAREKLLKNPPAYLAVQAADAIDRARPVNGKISHVERLVFVCRVHSAQRHEA